MSFDASVLQRLRQQIDQRTQEAVAQITSGRCADHSEYRYYCGMLRAFDEINHPHVEGDDQTGPSLCMIDQIIQDIQGNK